MWNIIFGLVAIYACIQFPLILLMAIVIISIWGVISYCEKKPKSIDRKIDINKEATNEKKEPIAEKVEKKEVKVNIPETTQVSENTGELYPESEFILEDEDIYNSNKFGGIK